MLEEEPVKPPVHDWQTVNQGLGDLFGQEAVQVGRGGAPARARGKLAPAWSGQQEVADPLDRRGIRSARDEIGEAFVALLKVNAGQRMGTSGFRWVDGHDQSAVGERGIVPALALAVGAEVTGFADAGHHIAPCAHTKREQVAVPCANREAVIGCAQRGMTAAGAMASRIDLLLGLLDADTELEWLGLEGDAAPQEHAVGISSAVADGEDHDLGRKMPRAGQDTSQPAVLEIEVLDPARESYLPAHLLELAPQGAHDQRQPVRPEVGAMLVEDGRLAVAFGQNFQDPQHVGPGIARGELAVAEGAGPPLSEEIVAFRVERAPSSNRRTSATRSFTARPRSRIKGR